MAEQRYQLNCPVCGDREVLGADDIPHRLASVGMLRRAEQPDADLYVELLHHAAPQLTCSACGHTGLDAGPYEPPRDEWGTDRLCAGCQAVIPPERVELFPDVTLCVDCQSREEAGGAAGPDEYCPRCGGVLQLRTAGGGISRYQQYCPSCRWRG